MSRTALFVIDIQRALADDPFCQIPYASRIQAAGTSLLSHARTAISAARKRHVQPMLDIVVVQHEETPEQGDLIRGSSAWELVFPPRKGDDCERLVGKDVRKSAFSILTKNGTVEIERG